ncbi:MAG: LamB/YcsF family protein [Magnetospirillum sp.]|nr:LamB/YcsF family protein [Magnetospirillum sp.]
MSGRTINLNADLGEECGDDAAMLDVVSAANIACGAHAGSPEVMAATVHAALTRGISIGAHPSYPDREGFGRRPMGLPAAEIERVTAEQIRLLTDIAAFEGGRIGHVKPHGALSNRAAIDGEAASAIVQAMLQVDSSLILLAPAGSVLVDVGRKAGLRVIEEVFADRAYDDDGNLVPRSRPGAMIHDPEEAARHVLRMAADGVIRTISGRLIPCRAQSICVHGDDAGAVSLARRVRVALEQARIAIIPLA